MFTVLCPPSSPPVSSEPWRLGSGVSAQSRGQEGVSQVPQTLHLVCARENRWEAHPLLSTEVTKASNCSRRHRQNVDVHKKKEPSVLSPSWRLLLRSRLLPVDLGFPAGRAALFGCSAPSALRAARVFRTRYMLDGRHTLRDLPPTACKRFNPPAVVTWATLTLVQRHLLAVDVFLCKFPKKSICERSFKLTISVFFLFCFLYISYNDILLDWFGPALYTSISAACCAAATVRTLREESSSRLGKHWWDTFFFFWGKKKLLFFPFSAFFQFSDLWLLSLRFRRGRRSQKLLDLSISRLSMK